MLAIYKLNPAHATLRESRREIDDGHKTASQDPPPQSDLFITELSWMNMA